MSNAISTLEEIPEAEVYVVMRDKFLSGWGEADGRDALYVFPCTSDEEAAFVKAYARERGDQDRIRVVKTRSSLPVSNDNQRVGLSRRSEASAWYPKAEEKTE